MNMGDNNEKKEIKKRDAIEVAVTYLSFADRTVGEIEAYLKKKEYSKEEISNTIQYLKDMRYVDDKNYTERYIEQATNRGKGSLKVKNELKKKGIEPELIEELNDEGKGFSKEAERQQAWEMAERFYEEVKESFKIEVGDDFDTKREKYKEKQKAQGKLGRRLISKGYPQELVYSIINSLFG